MSGWVPVAASVRGGGHERAGRPNEDAHAIEVGSSCVGAAVADGHGGDAHFRSVTGARLAVATLPLATGFLDAEPDASPEEIEARARDRLAGAIVERWRQTVARDIETRPLGGDGDERPGAADQWSVYGTTLLVAAVSAERLLLLQIGDGDIIVVDPGGGVASRPLPDDPGLVGRETNSLAMADAADRFRVVCLDLARHPCRLVFLSTDGFGSSIASADWERSVGLDLVRRSEELGSDEFRAQLERWLRVPAETGGDDTTMAVIMRSPVGP